MCNSAGRSTCHFCSAVLMYFPVFTLLHCGWSVLRVTFALQRCMSSVLNSCFRSKTRDSRMLHTTSIVSWIALAFVGLRESSEFGRGQQRVIGPSEVLEDRFHEVETELKEFREEACWIFQLRCSWTCSLYPLALLVVAKLSVSWICVRSCARGANVVVDTDGSQNRGVAPAVRGGGMVR